MTKHMEFWNNTFSKIVSAKPKYDFWLDKHVDILEKSRNTPIIDLGCGLGGDSLYLIEHGFKVISCDFSEVALERVMANIPQAQTLVVNMLEGLPFSNSTARIIIADLSLHYFYWRDTVKIVDEIKRVLIPDGYLLCRVNSVRDTLFGAGEGDILEENYYATHGNHKRFFDQELIEKLFIGWNLDYISEYQMDRYRYPKILWEFAARKGNESI